MSARFLARAAVAATLLVGPAAAAQHADTAGVHIKVPETIGEFRVRQRKDFESAAQGVMFRFAREDEVFADLFVYAGPDFATECDSACARGVIAREGDEFVAAFPKLVEMKYVDTIAVAGDRALVPDAGAAWRLGRHMRFTQRRHGQDEWSDFYLFYLPGYRLKVRATYAPDSAVATAIARFASAVAPALTGAAVATEEAEPRGVSISTTLPGAAGAHFALVTHLLAKYGYALEDSSLAAGRIVTAPRYTWPLGSEKESWHGDESPGVRLEIVVAPRGDSTTIAITGYSPTRPDWRNAKVAQSLELISVMELAGALPKPDGGRKRDPQDRE